jgi:hypothetical protein
MFILFYQSRRDVFAALEDAFCATVTPMQHFYRRHHAFAAGVIVRAGLKAFAFVDMLCQARDGGFAGHERISELCSSPACGLTLRKRRR